MADSKDWQAIAAQKREELMASIPQEYLLQPELLPSPSQHRCVKGIPESNWLLTVEEIIITVSTASRILNEIRNQTWSASTVTKAFIKRASYAHQLTNCLTTTLFPSALARAEELDTHLRTTGQPIGPLHGLPISLKDNFNITGHASSVGFVSWANDPASSNSTLVDILTSLGAIIYVKTNVPTAMMIPETVNNLFGTTTNPLNTALTPGGSSGGEAALIAACGSPLGVGTDIGGSLRIPAACTGLFTLRPSFGRFPTGGAKSGLAGQEGVNSVNGPLARDLEGLEVFAAAVVGAEPWRWDPKCLPIPWREVEAPKKMKIGVLWDDLMVRPTPPVRRVLKTVVENLKTAGHEIVDWKPEGHAEMLDVLGKFFTADGGKTVGKILEAVGEPWRPEMKAYEVATEQGVGEMWALQARRTSLITAYLQRWREAGIDCILCPTSPYATTEHGKFKHVGYTGVFNIVDYSAVSFPTGMVVNAERDRETESWKEYSDTDKAVRDEYNADAINGMPVSLQLVGQRLEEEKTIAMLKRVREALVSVYL